MDFKTSGFTQVFDILMHRPVAKEQEPIYTHSEYNFTGSLGYKEVNGAVKTFSADILLIGSLEKH